MSLLGCAPPRWVLLCGLVLVAATAAQATSARATRAPAHSTVNDDCDEMTLATGREYGHERDRRDDDEGTHTASGPTFVNADVVVPCAMIDSGALGPDCHDAAFYVVTTHGTPLCRIDLQTVASARSTDTIDDGPPASSTSPHGSALSPGTSVDTRSWRIPRSGVVELPAARGPRGLDGGRDVSGFVPRPS
jgi:hypothetical protein